MKNFPFKLSISTATTPWGTVAELAPRWAELGIGGVDVACRPARFDASKPVGWGNNAAVLDLDTLETGVGAVARALKENGLRCPVVLGYAEADDVATVRRLAGAARVLGAPAVRLWVARPEGRMREHFEAQRAAWARLVEAEEFRDLRFVVETHENTLCPSMSAALRLLDGLPTERAGVLYDVANTVREGTEPLALSLELLGDKLAGVHVKDVRRVEAVDEAWVGAATEHAPLGKGVMRWPMIFRALEERGFGGWVTLENFTGFDVGPERVAGDVAWLRGVAG